MTNIQLIEAQCRIEQVQTVLGLIDKALAGCM